VNWRATARPRIVGITGVWLRLAALVLLAALASSVPAPPASADCISECQAEIYCDPLNQAECTRKRGECYQERCPGSGRPRERPRVSGAHGAIAYDARAGAWGMADPSTNEEGAKRSALGHCAQHGKACKIVETFSRACAAVAQDTGDAIDWAVDADRRTAAIKAVEKCTKKSKRGPRCFVRLLRCYAE
jgi:hypothetical protein